MMARHLGIKATNNCDPDHDANHGFSRLVLWIIAIFLIVVVVFGGVILAFAHDIWINQGGYHNAAGEFCCGENDCKVPAAQHVTIPTVGYRLPSGEFVPEHEATPSPDGAYWVCRRGDQTIRCFFAPTESN